MIDPVTQAVMTVLLSEKTTKVIREAYNLLKEHITKEYGEESDVSQAVQDLEREPQSPEARQILQEKITATEADQNPRIVQLARTILAQIEAQPGQVQRKIVQALQDRDAMLPCPRCGNQRFTLVEGYLSHYIQKEPSSIVIGGPSIPTVAVVCTRCGFVSQHALGVLGLLPEEGKQNE